MSRAFVKEEDGANPVEDLGERLVSPHPNFVTERGLKLIDDEIERLRAQLGEATRAQDRAAIALASRDLRYWTQRRTSAQVVPPPEKPEKVAFGSKVTIEREDGKRKTFTIVGEDEADPAQGRIAYVAPMARALLGKHVGELADAPGGEAQIVAIS